MSGYHPVNLKIEDKKSVLVREKIKGKYPDFQKRQQVWRDIIERRK